MASSLEKTRLRDDVIPVTLIEINGVLFQQWEDKFNNRVN